MEQKILYTAEARKKLLNGVNKLADVVQSTLGPSGHNVILDLGTGVPVATKDGVTVAKAVNLTDPMENTGAQMLKQASIKTADEAGDGTTTATVLARKMYADSCIEGRVVPAINSVSLKRGIDDTVNDVIEYIKTNLSKPVTSVDQLKHVATISANGDEEVGKLISKALDHVGQDGAVTLEESKTGESYLDIVEGIQFDRGYKSPYFVTDNGSMQAILEDVVIFITDSRLTDVKKLLPMLNAVAQSDKSLLIVAEDIDSEVLSTLVLNKVRAGFRVCAVKAPEFGDKRKDALEDIAILTGGTVVSPEKGMKFESFTSEWFGTADKVTISRDKTTIIGAKGSQEALDARVEDIKKLIDNAKSMYDKEQYQSRLARFTGGIAVIYVGGDTELEMKERKDRVDDALWATKAALEEGICPGGGKALLLAANSLPAGEADSSESWKLGREIVLHACEEPFYQIIRNTDIDNNPATIATEVLTKDPWVSFNPRTGEYCNMFDKGIIDPTKVIRLALTNAASVAGTMITSEALVVNIPTKKDDSTSEDIQY